MPKPKHCEHRCAESPTPALNQFFGADSLVHSFTGILPSICFSSHPLISNVINELVANKRALNWKSIERITHFSVLSLFKSISSYYNIYYIIYYTIWSGFHIIIIRSQHIYNNIHRYFQSLVVCILSYGRSYGCFFDGFEEEWGEVLALLAINCNKLSANWINVWNNALFQ